MLFPTKFLYMNETGMPARQENYMHATSYGKTYSIVFFLTLVTLVVIDTEHHRQM
jgi:hypothetical protein